VIEEVTDQGQYQYSLNQLFMGWQKARARKIQGAELRALLTGAGLWLALFPPSSPSPLTQLAPLLEVHIPARGLMWSLFVSVVIALIPWSVIARPLPSALPSSLPRPLKGRALPGGLSRALWRFTRVCAWELPLLLTLVAGVFAVVQHTLGFIAWPLPWASPSLALLPPVLIGLGARFDVNYLKTRASKARFVEQFQRWNALHPLSDLLDKPRMQLPSSEHQGGLYDEDVRKILIVDQDLTVDILAKNGLHKRDKLLLLSLQKYPEPTAKFARRILALHPEEVEVYVLHHERRSQALINEQLRAIGVTPRHRTLSIGWESADLPRVISHLGFKPFDWGVFAVDTLSPKSLLEGVASAIAVRLPLARRLVRGGVLPPPPPPKSLTRQTQSVQPRASSPSDPQLDAFLTPEPSPELQGTALQATGDEP